MDITKLEEFKLNSEEMYYTFGGSKQAYCDALQEAANKHGGSWDNEDWDDWSEDWLKHCASQK